jgi:hypothetical protein
MFVATTSGNVKLKGKFTSMSIQVSWQSIKLRHCSYYAREDNIKMGFPQTTYYFDCSYNFQSDTISWNVGSEQELGN